MPEQRIDPFYRKELVMKLNDLYSKLAEIISNLDYESIWHGFKPLKFALYDDENVPILKKQMHFTQIPLFLIMANK